MMPAAALLRLLRARLLFGLAIVLAGWALVALATGGIQLTLAGISVSSRNPVRPAVVALLLAAAAWRLDPGWTERRVQSVLRALSSLRRAIVPLAAASVVVAGIAFGGRAAIGPDAFGYISQSVLWQRGQLKTEQPFVAMMPWPDADWTFSPLGYKPGAHHTLVPSYPPGFPLLLAGSRFVSCCAPYYVTPVSGALLVILTAMLGRRLFGRVTGNAGAVLVAASPVVLLWTLSPMTDVSVAALWLAALLAADTRQLTGVAVAGALSGIAILVRPNLATLALFPLLLSTIHAVSRRAVVARMVVFVVAVLPFVLFLGIVQWSLYGSPFVSGYGDPSFLYSPGHLWPNLKRYPVWWWQAHGLVGCLFLVTMFRRRPPEIARRVAVLAFFAIAVALSYVFYVPFEDDGFLRFMLPALPVLALLSADALVLMCSRFGPSAGAGLLIGVIALSVIHGIHRARWDGFYRNASADRRYVDAARYIESLTPPSSVVLAMNHSGSVRFYSGRLTLRFDLLDPQWLDRALETLERLGFSTYALLEDVEEAAFRRRFSDARALRLLDAGPLAIRRNPGGELRLFALKAPVSKHPPRPLEIPRTSRFECTQPSPRFATSFEVQP